MAFAQAYKEEAPDPRFASYQKAMYGEEAKEASRKLTGQAEMDGAETLFTDLLEKGVFLHFTQKDNLKDWVKRKTEGKIGGKAATGTSGGTSSPPAGVKAQSNLPWSFPCSFCWSLACSISGEPCGTII